MLFVCAVPAYAQKNTCSTEQLQLPAARECMRLLDQDLASKKDLPKTHMMICAISGMRCCLTDGKGHLSDCGPLLDSKVDDKKAADAKKKQEEEDKKKLEAKKKEEEAKKQEEEAKKIAAQKAADPKAGIKFECVPDKDGSKYAIKVFTTNTSDTARTCTVECTFARSDKKSGSTKCPDVRMNAHSPRQLMCTDWGSDRTGPGPFTNVAAKAECR
jgi:hypothetical protein